MPVLQTNRLTARRDVIKVFFSYCLADRAFVTGLIAYLQEYIASGLFSIVHTEPGHLDVSVVDSWDDSASRSHDRLRQLLDAANTVVTFLSPEYLACRGSMELEQLLQEEREIEISVRPIIIRPCYWQDSDFVKFNPIEGPVVPVSASEKEIKTKDFALILQEILRVVPIGSIFRPVGQPDLSFVVPDKERQLVMALSQLQRGLAVEGPSGIGKTTAVRHALREAMRRLTFIPRVTWIDAKKEDDKKELLAIIDDNFSRSGYLIIDEFHHLDVGVQRRVANLMKIISDAENGNSKVVIIGIGPIDASLLREFPELGGRFSTIRIARQPDRKIDELIRKGEEVANVEFNDRKRFVQEAGGSFYMAQEICYSACVINDVDCIQPSRVVISSDDIPQVINAIHDDLSAKYYDSICKLALLDEKRPPRGATAALLWMLQKSTAQNVSIRDAKAYYPGLESAFEWLAGGELAEIMRNDEALRRRFYYREKTQILSIDDPQLEFYFRHLDWEKFLDDTRQTDIVWDRQKGVVQSPQAGNRRNPQVPVNTPAGADVNLTPNLLSPSKPRRWKQSRKIRMLFLAASPDNLPRTSVSASGQAEEARLIDERLRSTEHAKKFELKQHWGLRPDEISPLLLKARPAIVHFCAEGDPDGSVILQDKLRIRTPLRKKVIIDIFRILSAKIDIKCVVMMACYSDEVAKGVSDYVDAVIGISRSSSPKSVTAAQLIRSRVQSGAGGSGRGVRGGCCSGR